MSESTRRKQWVNIIKNLEGVNDSHGTFILGDLNALLKEDYDSDEWQKIEEARGNAGLKRPKTELTEMVIEYDWT